MTWNKGFDDWVKLLADTVFASAILDWLLQHSLVLNIRRESYRLRDKRHAGLFNSHYVPKTAAENVDYNYAD